MKFCPMCKFHKPHKEFMSTSITTDGYSEFCRKCIEEYRSVMLCTKGKLSPSRDYSKDYYRKIKIRMNAINRRAKNLGSYGILTIYNLESSLYDAEYKCLRCESKEDLCVDHIIPLSKGGFNTEDNIQILCRRCNSSKSAKIKDYRKH